MIETQDFLFIIGAPRSGTTMMQVLLSEHPKVATTVELTLFRRYVAPWLEAFEEEVRNSQEKGWHQGLPFVWKREDLVGFLREFIAHTYGEVLKQKPTATHLLDKHPGYSMHTHRILEVVPRAKFIHVIRDGRDVACSMVAAARSAKFGTSTIGESAAAWQKFLRAARTAANAENYLEVRYEEFLQDTKAGYTRLLDFCQLPYEQQWLEETVEKNSFEKMKAARRTGDPKVQSSETHYRKGKAGTWREEMTTREAYEFEQIAGDLLRELHYEEGPDWWQRSSLDRILTPLASKIRRKLRR